jgi:hypothetical protein
MSFDLKKIIASPSGVSPHLLAEDQFLAAGQRDVCTPIPPPPEHFDLIDPKTLPKVPHPSDFLRASHADDVNMRHFGTALQKKGLSMDSQSLVKDEKLEHIFQSTLCLQDSEVSPQVKRVRFSDGVGPGDSSC